MSYKEQNGPSWHDLFEPRKSGDPSVDATGYKINDGSTTKDAADIFAPLSAGLRIDGDTGYSVGSQDVADIFAAKGSRGGALSVSVPSRLTLGCTSSGSSCTATGTIRARVSGGKSPYSYAWAKVSGSGSIESGASTATVKVKASTNGSKTGVFRCTVTDGNNATAHDECTVTFDYTYDDDLEATIPATAGGSCSASGTCTASATIEVTATKGKPPYSYVWTLHTGPAEIVSGKYSKTCTVAQSIKKNTQTEFDCHVTDSTGHTIITNVCVVTLAYYYSSDLKASASPAHQTSYCATDGSGCEAAAMVSCTPSGGAPPYQYDWEVVSGNAKISNLHLHQASATFSSYTTGTKVNKIRCKVTDSRGYTATTNTVEWDAVYSYVSTLAASIPQSTSCSCFTSGSSCTATKQLSCTVSGGKSPFTYHWEVVSGAGTIQSGGTSDRATVADVVSDQAQSTYRCKVTDSHGTGVYSNNCLVTFNYSHSGDSGGPGRKPPITVIK
jgi:hypothetical protein